MSQFLKFHFDLNDPKGYSKIFIINDKPYIAHSFIQVPIYDDFNVKIGYKTADNYIQQVDENKYSIRISSTYNFFNNNSSINWQFTFLTDTPSYKYPTDKINASNIVSATGDYFGKSGVVSLKAYDSGLREVTIGFNFN